MNASSLKDSDGGTWTLELTEDLVACCWSSRAMDEVVHYLGHNLLDAAVHIAQPLFPSSAQDIGTLLQRSGYAGKAEASERSCAYIHELRKTENGLLKGGSKASLEFELQYSTDIVWKWASSKIQSIVAHQ